MKKHIYIVCCLLYTAYSFAQPPQAIPYQAVARDNNGDVIANQNISLRFSIHDATSGGTVVYKETQSIITNSLGLFSVNVGQGTPIIGTFASIAWATNAKFIQVEMDATGGVAYVDMGTQQMMSVPYALFSGASQNSQWTTNGNDINNANSGNVGINAGSPLGKLHIKGSANASQFIVDANSSQSNTNPLIKLRKSDGTDLMWIHSDDSTNSFIGRNAGRSNVVGPQGVNNLFFGNNAGYSNTNGRDNISIGINALYSNAKASNNVAIGTNALYTQSFSPSAGAFWQSYNVAVGYEALYSNQPTSGTSGVNNTAIGTSALRSNSTGYQNTAVGANALYLNTTGNYNTANGRLALSANNTGSQNTGIGAYTLYLNTSGSFNTGVGLLALGANTAGYENTGIGNEALSLNTTGYDNTANGYDALYRNTTASENTSIGSYSLFNQAFSNGGVTWVSGNVAVGHFALNANAPDAVTNGIHNTAVGHSALFTNNTGYENTAIGFEALYSNQRTAGIEGIENTAMGSRALRNNTLGLENTACGTSALFTNTTGTTNTAVGYNALKLPPGGLGNTAIGYSAGLGSAGVNFNFCTFLGGSSSLSTFRTNVTMVGYSVANAQCTGDNQVLLGNTSVSQIRAQVTGITSYSDARFKTNIAEDVKGLNFIMRLKPVTYNMRPKELHRIWGTPDSVVNKIDHSQIEQQRFIGLLAQDVEKAAHESGFDFPGIDVPRNDKEVYSLRYVDFIMPMIKAMQEQQAIIEEQKKMIAEIKNENENLKTDNSAFKTDIEKIKAQLGMEVKAEK